MRIAPLLLVAATACTPLGERGLLGGACPTGATCSPETPNGLSFFGTQLDGVFFQPDGPAPTAVGGTQDIYLEWDEDGSGLDTPLSIPFVAQIDDGSGGGLEVVGTQGATVTVRGTVAGASYLDIVDPDGGALFDRYIIETADVGSVTLSPLDYEQPLTETTPIAFEAGSANVVVELQTSDDPNTAERLVDTSMTLTSPRAQRTAWDTLALADTTTGSDAIAVTAGGTPWPALGYSVVSGVGALAVVGPPPTIASGDGDICFAAMAGGAQVYELPDWSITSSDLTVEQIESPSCAALFVKPGTTVGHVTASAGGATLTTTVAVQSDGTIAPRGSRRATPWRAPEGERAAAAR
jgi:hypothetical protein|nr:hypothetical protein [Kofleriaceae bacterium]